MNGEHLSPKTRELLGRPIEERIAYIQLDSWISYSQANKILQQLEDLLNHPKCDRMPNLAITAQPNNGIHIIEARVEGHHRRHEAGFDILVFGQLKDLRSLAAEFP
jgi:Bacterial TniB protein